MLKFMCYYFKGRNFSKENVWWGEKTAEIENDDFCYIFQEISCIFCFVALIKEKFQRFSFYFNLKVYNVKIQFFLHCSKLEAIIAEETHLLEKHSETDISQMGTVSVVRDKRIFMEIQDFRKMNFFADSHGKNFLNIYF